MAEQAWKTFQRRIARMWGGEATWRGEQGSDGRGRRADGSVAVCPVALEVKRRKDGCIRMADVAQAIAQGKAEGQPWVLVVGGHRDKRPKAVVDHAWLVELARKAGVLEAS